MLEFRTRNEGPVQTPGADMDLGIEDDVDKYLTLTARYGLDDMEIGESDGIEQTIEQEYQAYVIAPLSKKDVDIFRFWEVGEFVNDILVVSLMRHHR